MRQDPLYARAPLGVRMILAAVLAAASPSPSLAGRDGPEMNPVRLNRAISANRATPNPVAADRATASGPRTPTRLRLWKFDARVVPVHLTGSELVPPRDPALLGWWGQPAGSPHGTTLLVGHTVHTGGGVLDDLEDTPIDDIANVSGVRYRVTRVEIITKAELAKRARKLFGRRGRPKLVLVTCTGYDWGTGRYPDNVVVITRPLIARPWTARPWTGGAARGGRRTPRNDPGPAAPPAGPRPAHRF